MEDFIKVAAATPKVKVADCTYNQEQLIAVVRRAEAEGCDAVCCPELCLTAYTCQDLFQQDLLLKQSLQALANLRAATKGLRVIVLVGLPLQLRGRLFNCAAVIGDGHIYGIVPKSYIPNYREFYEARWFSSAFSLDKDATITLEGETIPVSAGVIFQTPRFSFGVEICEDLWAPQPPSTYLAQQGAEIIFNLSASNELTGKHAYRRALVAGQSARCHCGYIYAGAGFGESTQDLVFSGADLVAENGKIIAESQRYTLDAQFIFSDIDVVQLRHERMVNTSFHTSPQPHTLAPTIIALPQRNSDTKTALLRSVNPLPFVPEGNELADRCEEILHIQSLSLAQRLQHTNAKTAVVGISGGLDSTLALLVCTRTFDLLGRDRADIVGITMPGFGTTDRTYNNALKLMKGLGITIREISIRAACEQHFKDLGADMASHDVVYENGQARERTQILMDAANQMGGLVIGTGDLSELALGWATYNGDHMSMYGVNASIPKTLVRHLVAHVAQHTADDEISATLIDVLDTPISPELIPADKNGQIVQKTEDLVGPYELHDFFLYHFLHNGSRPSKVFNLACAAFDGNNPRVAQFQPAVILKWLRTFLRRFFTQQFKRSCLPDGPMVGSCSLSPRGLWRMPSDATATDWLKECDSLTPNTATR